MRTQAVKDFIWEHQDLFCYSPEDKCETVTDELLVETLLPLLKLFRREFYLVGGTAIALQIGHRKSIDFDLFKGNSINSKKILIE